MATEKLQRILLRRRQGRLKRPKPARRPCTNLRQEAERTVAISRSDLTASRWGREGGQHGKTPPKGWAGRSEVGSSLEKSAAEKGGSRTTASVTIVITLTPVQ